MVRRSVAANPPIILFARIGTNPGDESALGVVSARRGYDLHDATLTDRGVTDDRIMQFTYVADVWLRRRDINAIARTAREEPIPVGLRAERPTRLARQVSLIEL